MGSFFSLRSFLQCHNWGEVKNYDNNNAAVKMQTCYMIFVIINNDMLEPIVNWCYMCRQRTEPEVSENLTFH